jgi:ATP-dependent helicase/nuclease subunit A
LDRFLSWFSRGTVDVQRDPGSPANEVRVMTVHGAKGLEAPVVILADATADPNRLGRPPITVDLDVGPARDAPLLRPRKEERCPPFEEIIQGQEKRDLEEHMRLLYVALTRAADRLIVSGVMPKAKKDGSDPRPANSWHVIVEQAMTSLGTPGIYGSLTSAKVKKGKDKSILPPVVVPDWAKREAPPEARPPRPLAPSAIAADDEAAPPPSEAMRAAAQRGILIHSLLERLAPVEEGARAGAAERWLERSAGLADAAARKEIVEQVCGILSDPAYADLFGPGSLAEAPLAATLPDGRVIAGTVDRLLVEEAKVSVIDFKTGKVPSTEGDIPRTHRAQMAAYVEALRVIFPGREVRAALLYTAGPELYEVTA